MKYIITAFILLLGLQASSQEVIASQGKSFTTASSSIDYTIGEVVIATYSSASIVVTQGFHQTNLNVLGLEDFNNDYSMKVFPNPTSDVLKLDIVNFQNLKFSLYDIEGREILEHLITDKLTDISMEQLGKGVYILSILSDTNQKIKTYKIIKN